jgi:hypothetical protein
MQTEITDAATYAVASALGERLPAPSGSKVIQIVVETSDYDRTNVSFEGMYPTREDGILDLARWCITRWFDYDNEPWRSDEQLGLKLAQVAEETGFDDDDVFDELGARRMDRHTPQDIVDRYFDAEEETLTIREQVVDTSAPWNGRNEYLSFPS